MKLALKSKDPLEILSEQQRRISRMVDPYKEMRERQERMNKALAPRIPDIYKEMRERQERISKAFSPRIPDIYKEMRERQERMNEAFALRAPDPYKEIRERQERISKAFALRVPEPYEEMRKRQERMNEAFALRTPDLYKEIREHQERWLSVYAQPQEIPMGEVEALEDGLISVSGEVVNADQLHQDIVNISENTENQEQLLDKLFAWFSKLSKGAKFVALIILFPIILNVISNLVTPLAYDFISDHTTLTQKEAIPAIVKDANELFTSTELHSHRLQQYRC